MFTGIIRDIGEIKNVVPKDVCLELLVFSKMDFADLKIGDSIAIDGTCLTITSFDATSKLLKFDVGAETLQKTSLANIKIGTKVHLEKALRFSDRLGGHLVQGHVDGMATLSHVERAGDSLVLKFSCPKNLLLLCVPKGSIAINGVSLTVNHVFADGFDVCLIPQTLKETFLGSLKPGESVNIENDLIGKYVRNFFDMNAKMHLGGSHESA